MVDEPRVLFDCVAFHVTDRCNVACDHCMPDSGPGRTRTMAPSDARRWIDALARLGRTRKISLTGGEPFVVRHVLEAATEAARLNSLQCGVMTNASWGTTRDTALRVLRQYPGITEIGISTDAFHRQHINDECVTNVIDACAELGIHASVRVTYLRNAEREVGESRARLGSALAGLRSFEAQPVHDLGRARRLIPIKELFRMPESALRQACRVADTPTIGPDGDVHACCGPALEVGPESPLRLGSLRRSSLAEVMEATDANLVLHFVRAIGPWELHQHVLKCTRVASGAGEVRHICDACLGALGTPEAGALARAYVEQPEVERRTQVSRLIELGEA